MVQWRIDATEAIAGGDRVATERSPLVPGTRRRSRAAAARKTRQVAGGQQAPARRSGRRRRPACGKRIARPPGDIAAGRARAWPRPATRRSSGRRSFAVVPYRGPERNASPADVHRMPRRRPSSCSPRESLSSAAISRGRWGPAIRWRRPCGPSANSCWPRAASIRSTTASPIRCCWCGPAASRPITPPGRPCDRHTATSATNWWTRIGNSVIRPPTHACSQVLQQAVSDARREQLMLMEAAPRQYGGRRLAMAYAERGRRRIARYERRRLSAGGGGG